MNTLEDSIYHRYVPFAFTRYLEFEANLCEQYIKTEIYREISSNILTFTHDRLRRLGRHAEFNLFTNSKKYRN